mmetsp:Transcript_165821/g.402989  ORF Transcript_165821/g.402989 Transcript_165821/m.402989 type:complete len:434 (+) Transcript_165821:46-1347(+)
MPVTSKRPTSAGTAAGFVRLFAPAKRCRAATTGELLVADSDSEEAEILDAKPQAAEEGPACDGQVHAADGAATGREEFAVATCEPDALQEGLVTPQADALDARPLPSEEAPASHDVPVTQEVPLEDHHSDVDCTGPLIHSGVQEASAQCPQEGDETEVEDDLSEQEGGRPAVAAADGLFDNFKFDFPVGASPGPRTPCSQSRGRQRSCKLGVGLTSPPALARQASWSGRASTSKGRDADTGGRASTSRRKKAAEGEEDFASAPAELRQRVLEKWRDMAGGAADPAALRLQLLVAAILHPKTSEGIVRGCLAKLTTWAEPRQTPETAQPRGISAALLAQTAPGELVELWEGLHWHKVKAARVVAAAVALERDWGGTVPLLKEELIKLPGIGPKLANVLAFVCDGLASDSSSQAEAEQAVKEVPEDVPESVILEV